MIGYVCGARLPNIFCIWTAFNYLPFFILGMKLREKSTCFLYKLPSILFLFAQFKKIVALSNLIQRIYHNDIRNMLP